jgi:Ca-activated chloride channel homolog
MESFAIMSWRCSGVVFGSLMVGMSLLAQEQPFRIRVDAPEVSLEAIVQDRNGRALTDLAQTDFEIYEDGQLQEITYFASAETPRSLLLLFDVSESTDSQRPFMVEAINGFLASLRQKDRIAIGAFAEDVRILMNWRGSEGGARDLRLPASQSLSNVYPALEKALGLFGNETARKGIIVMTDGRDTVFFKDIAAHRKILDISQDRNFQGLLQNIRKRGIPLYFIALNTDRNRALTPNDQEYVSLGIQLGPAVADEYLVAVRERMERLSEVAGGRILYPRSLQEVAPLYEAIGRELGLSYSLGYAPRNRAADGKAHRIEVRVRREGVKVTQSRDTYTSR